MRIVYFVQVPFKMQKYISSHNNPILVVLVGLAWNNMVNSGSMCLVTERTNERKASEQESTDHRGIINTGEQE